MPDLNKNEYGQKIYVNMGEDISTNIAISMEIQSRIGDLKTLSSSDGVAVGTVNIDVDDETFIANEYLEYTIKDGDLDGAGVWRKKGIVEIDATTKVI
jgi:hypothetical protein